MESEAARPGYWDDPCQAQARTKQLERLKETATIWNNLRSQSRELLELARMALEEEDATLDSELAARGESLAADLEREEINLALSGTTDDRPAILSIQAGTGGADAHDWAGMLLRMYLLWAEANDRSVETLDLAPGDRGGIRNASLEIGGRFAHGFLRAERGVHRLVRISPYSPKGARHTSFARVEVIPAAPEEESEIEIRSEDLKMDLFRSGGPGGQNVQKVNSAVRLTHLPTGVIAVCRTERSQYQNREYALRVLRARLEECRRIRQAAERAELKGETPPPNGDGRSAATSCIPGKW